MLELCDQAFNAVEQREEAIGLGGGGFGPPAGGGVFAEEGMEADAAIGGRQGRQREGNEQSEVVAGGGERTGGWLRILTGVAVAAGITVVARPGRRAIGDTGQQTLDEGAGPVGAFG